MRPAPRLAAVTGAVLTVAGLAACSAGPLATGADAAHGLVGVAMPSTTLARWTGDAANVEAQVRALGHDVEVRFADDDATLQAEQLDELLGLGADVLVVPSGQTAFADVATDGWSGDLAAERMRGLVGGPTLAGVLAPYDGISRGVLGEAGYGTPARPWPAVTGQDAEVESVRSVLAGEQRSTIYKDTRQLAEVAVTMVDALLEGRSPEVNDVTSYDNGAGVVPAYLLTPQLIDADNAEDVLVGGGFYTAEDLR